MAARSAIPAAALAGAPAARRSPRACGRRRRCSGCRFGRSASVCGVARGADVQRIGVESWQWPDSPDLWQAPSTAGVARRV